MKYDTYHVTDEEKEFPIAFSILTYKDSDQTERLYGDIRFGVIIPSMSLEPLYIFSIFTISKFVFSGNVWCGKLMKYFHFVHTQKSFVGINR
jgi:hypothetical protein